MTVKILQSARKHYSAKQEFLVKSKFLGLLFMTLLSLPNVTFAQQDAEKAAQDTAKATTKEAKKAAKASKDAGQKSVDATAKAAQTTGHAVKKGTKDATKRPRRAYRRLKKLQSSSAGCSPTRRMPAPG